MGEVTATDTFDPEELEPDVADDLEPVLDWLNTNTQNIVDILRGNIGDRNLATQTVQLKASSGVRQFFRVPGRVSHVELSRVSSQPDANIFMTGFNWWPASDGFDFLAQWSGETQTRNIYLRIHFDV